MKHGFHGSVFLDQKGFTTEETVGSSSGLVDLFLSVISVSSVKSVLLFVVSQIHRDLTDFPARRIEFPTVIPAPPLTTPPGKGFRRSAVDCLLENSALQMQGVGPIFKSVPTE